MYIIIRDSKSNILAMVSDSNFVFIYKDWVKTNKLDEHNNLVEIHSYFVVLVDRPPLCLHSLEINLTISDGETEKPFKGFDI